MASRWLRFKDWHKYQPKAPRQGGGWVRLYRHEEARFATLPLMTRALHAELLKLTNNKGEIDLAEGLEPWVSVCRALGATQGDRRVVRKHLTALIEAGFLLLETDASCARGEHEVSTSLTRGEHELDASEGLSARNDIPPLNREREEREREESLSGDLDEAEGLRRHALRAYRQRFEVRWQTGYQSAGKHREAFGQLAALALDQRRLDGRPAAEVLDTVLDAYFADGGEWPTRSKHTPTLLVNHWATYATNAPDPDAYVPVPIEDPEARRARLRAQR